MVCNQNFYKKFVLLKETGNQVLRSFRSSIWENIDLGIRRHLAADYGSEYIGQVI